MLLHCSPPLEADDPEPWLDENGNFVEVVPKPGLPAPFDIWEDPWCDLTFLRKMAVFKDMYVPSWEELADSGFGDAWEAKQKMEWEAEMKTQRREENIHRKMMMRLYPELVWRKQKKAGRTRRKRRLARIARVDRAWEEEMGIIPRCPKRDPSLLVTESYDEHVMKQALPRAWKTSFWMMAVVDDGRDYKYVMYDKSKECFWPAVNIPKRTLGYDLLTFMPVVPRLSKRSNSIAALDREGTSEDATVRADAHKRRRSKSETALDEECSHWNLLKREERETFEDDCDLYVQLVEMEIQDEIDRVGLEYFYAF